MQMIDSISTILSSITLDDVSLVFLTTFSSTIAGVFGLGGGLVLVVMLPWFVPANAVVPIHGITQLGSNISRLMLSYRYVVWSLGPRFIFGTVFGIALFSLVLTSLSTKYIPVIIAIYLLLSLWIKAFEKLLSKIESFFVVGMLQGGLGLIVGAPGPLAITLLMKKLSHPDQIIATASLMLSFVNLAKVVTYAIFGFVFWDYIHSIIFAIIGAFIGSFIGTIIRKKVDPDRFLHLLKWLLTILALQTLIRFSFF